MSARNAGSVFALVSFIFMVTLSFAYDKDTLTTGTLPVKLKRVAKMDLPGKGDSIAINGDMAYVHYWRYDDDGTYLVDIHDPEKPRLVKDFKSSQWHKLLFQGDMMYAINGQMFSAYNNADATSPSLIGSIKLGGSLCDFIHSGGLFYVIDKCNGMFQMLDARDPKSIHVIGRLSLSETGTRKISFLNKQYDIPFKNDPSVSALSLSGSRVYVTATHMGNLQVGILWTIDVAEPIKPRIIGKLLFEEAAYCVTAEEHFLVVGCQNGMDVIDATDPVKSMRLGRYKPLADAAENMVLDHGFVYFCIRGIGVQIIDISNPVSPKFVSSYSSRDYKQPECFLSPAGLAFHRGFLFVAWDDGNDPNPGGGLEIVDVRRMLSK